MKITLLGVLVVLSAGVLLWYVFRQIEQHNGQPVDFDEQPNPNQSLGPNANPEF